MKEGFALTEAGSVALVLSDRHRCRSGIGREHAQTQPLDSKPGGGFSLVAIQEKFASRGNLYREGEVRGLVLRYYFVLRAAHPERFVRGAPQPAALPTAVSINPPKGGGIGEGTTTETDGADEERRHGTRRALRAPILDFGSSCLISVDTLRGEGLGGSSVAPGSAHSLRTWVRRRRDCRDVGVRRAGEPA